MSIWPKEPSGVLRRSTDGQTHLYILYSNGRRGLPYAARVCDGYSEEPHEGLHGSAALDWDCVVCQAYFYSGDGTRPWGKT